MRRAQLHGVDVRLQVLGQRTQVPHVRVYNEDREVTAWFLCDLSPSVDFGSGEVSKRAVLTEFVAVLARLLTRQGNKVGAILYDGINLFVVPPRGGREHVLHIISRIMANPRLLRAPQTESRLADLGF